MAEGLRVAEVLQEQGRQKGWLADVLGVSRTHLTRLLRGERRWTEEHRKTAVLALGVPEGMLFGDGGSPSQPSPADLGRSEGEGQGLA